MQCPTLDAARAACELPLERLHTIARDMVHEMRQGLAAEGCQLLMLPSHVTSLPDGCGSSEALTIAPSLCLCVAPRQL